MDQPADRHLLKLRAVILLAASQLDHLEGPEWRPLRQAVLQANHLIRTVLTPDQTQQAIDLSRRLQQVLGQSG